MVMMMHVRMSIIAISFLFSDIAKGFFIAANNCNIFKPTKMLYLPITLKLRIYMEVNLRLAIVVVLVVLMSASVIGQAAWAADEPAEKNINEPIKIALLYNGTGPMAPIDEPSYKGALLAAKIINAKGGIANAGKLELIPLDTKSDATRAMSAYSDERHKDVVAAIGYGDSTFVIAAAPSFLDKGIPFITPGATLPKLIPMLGDRLFMVAYGDNAQSKAIADYTYKELNIKKIAVWTDTSMEFTLALSDTFKYFFTESGGTVLYEDKFKSGGPTPPDLSEMVEKLRTSEPKPEAVFVSAVPEEAALSVKLLRNGGIGIPIVSGDGFDSQLVLKAETAKPVTSVYFSTHSYRGEKRPEVTGFLEAYKKEYGVEPEDAFAALGFDALNILADAIRRAGSADKDAIAKALSETKDFKAVTGTMTMRPYMPPAKPVAIVEIKDGKYTLVHTWNP
jgi:branched-chain amino acid transport system substrate-binding protein